MQSRDSGSSKAGFLFSELSTVPASYCNECPNCDNSIRGGSDVLAGVSAAAAG